MNNKLLISAATVTAASGLVAMFLFGSACTVTSSTSDGGSFVGNTNDGGNTNDAASTNDAATDGGVCPVLGNQFITVDNGGLCDQCLATSCCAEKQACEGLGSLDGGTNDAGLLVDCPGFFADYSQCPASEDGGTNECQQGVLSAHSSESAAGAFALEDCVAQRCTAGCTP